MEAIIKLENAVVRQQKNTILKEVSLEIAEGEFVYLIGKVGSGKSSLLKTLYAELPLEYGQGEVAGYKLNKIKKSQIAYLRRKCGIVFQDFKLLTDRNVYANLEFVLKATGWKDKKAIRERISEVLEKVGLPDKRDKFPHQLSGGEQQRIVLARALLNAPPIILADEPTGNIDPETAYHLVELLKDISDSGKTIVIATHQYDLIEHFPGRVFRCENGTLREDFSFAEKQAARNKVINDGLESEFVDVGNPVIEETVKDIEDIDLTDEPDNTRIEDVIQETDTPIAMPEEMVEIIPESETPEEIIPVEEENMVLNDTPAEEQPSEEEKKKKDDNDPDIVGFELI